MARIKKVKGWVTSYPLPHIVLTENWGAQVRGIGMLIARDTADDVKNPIYVRIAKFEPYLSLNESPFGVGPYIIDYSKAGLVYAEVYGWKIENHNIIFANGIKEKGYGVVYKPIVWMKPLIVEVKFDDRTRIVVEEKFIEYLKKYMNVEKLEFEEEEVSERDAKFMSLGVKTLPYIVATDVEKLPVAFPPKEESQK